VQLLNKYIACSCVSHVISIFIFQNNNKEEQIRMTLCGISSLVVTDGNLIAMEYKLFNVRFYSDNCRLLSQPSFIDLDNDFLHCIFESLVIHIYDL
jgi:hypothetical protein